MLAQIGILFLMCVMTNGLYYNDVSLKCHGTVYSNVSLTAYYPDYSDEDHERGYQDEKANTLRTLQDYVDNRAEFVTLAMDEKLEIPYGTKACIPELNEHFGHQILLEIRDASTDLFGSGFTSAEICVRTEIDSYDKIVNRFVTLVISNDN